MDEARGYAMGHRLSQRTIVAAKKFFLMRVDGPHILGLQSICFKDMHRHIRAAWTVPNLAICTVRVPCYAYQKGEAGQDCSESYLIRPQGETARAVYVSSALSEDIERTNPARVSDLF